MIMELLIGFVLGGIVVAYWRDKKFRDFINVKLGRKPQPKKKQEERREIPKNDNHPVI